MQKHPPMGAGQKYGRLVALRCVGKDPYNQKKWQFLCDCGQETVATATNVRHGRTRSCGCLYKETRAYKGSPRDGARTTHNLSGAPEYHVWVSIKQRCLNSKEPGFRFYGGRGIKVCERWMRFEHFYADMGPRPSPELSIDRINNDGDYEPGNCRWATSKQQKRNQRRNRIVTHDGRQMTIAEACELTGMTHALVSERLKRGWSTERALSAPPRKAGLRLPPSF